MSEAETPEERNARIGHAADEVRRVVKVLHASSVRPMPSPYVQKPAVTLPDFLLARIAEDEIGARSGYGDGRMDHRALHPKRWLAECEAKRLLLAAHMPVEREMIRACVRHQRPKPPYNQHLFCPDCTTSPFTECLRCSCRDELPCFETRVLGLPYADHPDYREEWRP